MMKSIDKTAKKNPFRVPDNYLEGINERILAATVDQKETLLKVVYRRRKPYLRIAVSVSGLILLSYICYRLIIPSDRNLQLSEVVNRNNIEVLMNELDVNLIEENTGDSAFVEEASYVSSSAIIDYLSKENIDLNEIYDRL